LPPAFVQSMLLIGTRAGRAQPEGSRGRSLALALVALLAISTGVTGIWLHHIAGPAVFGPRVPLRPVSRAYRSSAVPRVIHYLRRHAREGEAIFVARQEPLLYFATDTRNPTPFEGVLPGLREWEEPIILDALANVRYVVVSDIDQPTYTYYGDELPKVWAYLERHFQVPRNYPIDDASWITALERGPDLGPAVIDLVSAPGRAWVRDADGVEHPATERPQHIATRLLHRPLPIALGPRGGGIDFVVHVPEGAVFRAAVGFRALVSIDDQYIHPPGATTLVELGSGDAFETVASLRVDDGLRAGRRWTPLTADLSAWAGRDVTLRLEVEVADPLPPGTLSWFGSPRITVPPALDTPASATGVVR